VPPLDQSGTAGTLVPAARRVAFFTYLAQEILLVDFSGGDPETAKAVAAECARQVSSRPFGSVRTLVDITGMHFNKQTIRFVQELAKRNAPYVIRSAVLGVDGLRAIGYQAVVSFSKREIKIFAKREEALAWLIQ
jgi:hypothetical protein